MSPRANHLYRALPGMMTDIIKQNDILLVGDESFHEARQLKTRRNSIENLLIGRIDYRHGY